VADLQEEAVIIDVNGIGYQIFCPNPYTFQKEIGETVTVYTYQHVREDAILLFGFATREEQALFRKLLDVSGIGPKGALSIIAGTRPEQLVQAVQQENVVWLTKLPGVGKKTAQRMILDLKDKLVGWGSQHSAANGLDELRKPKPSLTGNPVLDEVKEGLIALGYASVEADRVLQEIAPEVKETDTVDKLLRRALQQFLRKSR
jgi:Holliday junction DNA helicase RuvA